VRELRRQFAWIIGGGRSRLVAWGNFEVDLGFAGGGPNAQLVRAGRQAEDAFEVSAVIGLDLRGGSFTIENFDAGEGAASPAMTT